jgi:hypothetical protein
MPRAMQAKAARDKHAQTMTGKCGVYSLQDNFPLTQSFYSYRQVLPALARATS